MLNEPSAKTSGTSQQQIGEYARIKHKAAHKQKRNPLFKATAKQEPDPTTHIHHLRAGVAIQTRFTSHRKQSATVRI